MTPEDGEGAHHWARVFTQLGHMVKIMAPQFVKPYVKSNKHDAADAEAICEAVQRPSMCFVPEKSIEQQDIQSLHRIRSQRVSCYSCYSIHYSIHCYSLYLTFFCFNPLIDSINRLIVKCIEVKTLWENLSSSLKDFYSVSSIS